MNHSSSATVWTVAQALADNGALQTHAENLAAHLVGGIQADTHTAFGSIVQVLELEDGIRTPADATFIHSNSAWAA